VYSEEESRTVVGATFRAKDRAGNDKEWYYLMAFEPGAKGEAPKELYGALASIDDPDYGHSTDVLGPERFTHCREVALRAAGSVHYFGY
jgi:hypothetical protein